MLTQRIVKAYCQIHLEIRVGAAERILQDSIDRFDSELASLNGAANTPEIRKALAHERDIWLKIKPFLLNETTHEGAHRLHDLSEFLSDAAQKLDDLLEKQTHARGIEWMDVAGRQRMLSQRVAAFYLLRKMGIHSPEMTKNLEKAKSEFNSLQDELLSGAQNNPDIVSELQLVKTQWKLLSSVLGNLNPSANDLATMIISSERILETMERATVMFEQAYDTAAVSH